MRIIVTTGPSYEPIDQVRRLTNFSTGELGVLIANAFAAAGHTVTCLRGVGATYRGACIGAMEQPFTTNDDLLAQLTELSTAAAYDAVFHVAALCDFKVAGIDNPDGEPLASAKIDSRVDALTLRLVPARKLISALRTLFPRATLVGWKYELAGSRDDALAKAWRQIRENRTDACVVNGAAWGEGFGLCTPLDSIAAIGTKPELATFLTEWLPRVRNTL